MEDRLRSTWQIGTVKFFNQDKGFGFIKSFEEDVDYYFSKETVFDEIPKENETVLYKIREARKKYIVEAYKVSKLDRFSANLSLLASKFSKLTDIQLRTNIYEKVAKADIVEFLGLTEGLISDFNDNKQIESYLTLKQNLSINTSIDNRSLVENYFDSQIIKYSSPETIWQLWLQGKLEPIPPIEIIFENFKEDGLRKIILTRVPLTIGQQLLREVIKNEGVYKVLEWLWNYLLDAHNVWTEEAQVNINRKEFWHDSNEYELFKSIGSEYDSSLSIEDKFLLHLNCHCFSLKERDLKENINLLTLPLLKRVLIDDYSENYVLTILQSFQRKIHENLDKNLTSESFLKCIEENLAVSKFLESYKAISEFYRTIKKNNTNIYKKILLTDFSLNPEWIQILLWKENIGSVPVSFVSRYIIASNENVFNEINWSSISIKTQEQILRNCFINFGEIYTSKKFYLFLKLLIISEGKIKLAEIYNCLEKRSIKFLEFANWLFNHYMELKLYNGEKLECNYEIIKELIIYLKPEDQIISLKCLLHDAINGKLELKIEMLEEIVRVDYDIYSLARNNNPELSLDLSVEIVIQSILGFHRKGAFLLDSELIDILYKNISTKNNKHLSIKGFFAECPGRAITFKSYASKGIVKAFENNGQKSLTISFGSEFCENNDFHYKGWELYNQNFDGIKEAVKKLPQRSWDPDSKQWLVPFKYSSEVCEFARINDFIIDIGEDLKISNKHFYRVKRIEKPQEELFCEGRLSNKLDALTGKKFWWCFNSPCHENYKSEDIYSFASSIEKYTLFDFLKYFNCNLDSVSHVGEVIENGKYFQFIGTLNRFNKLLEHLYCRQCNHMLYPNIDSHFAHYRVVRFSCRNEACSEVNKEIYLHHCLNGRCNSIIDSRDSKKCSNGLYICKNTKCGCCCSHEMLNRRLTNLRTVGSYIPAQLVFAVEQKLGHLERAEHYCYNCGDIMDEKSGDIYYCKKCRITYELSKNKFARPHRYLSSNNEKSIYNLDENDISDDLIGT